MFEVDDPKGDLYRGALQAYRLACESQNPARMATAVVALGAARRAIGRPPLQEMDEPAMNIARQFGR